MTKLDVEFFANFLCGFEPAKVQLNDLLCEDGTKENYALAPVIIVPNSDMLLAILLTPRPISF